MSLKFRTVQRACLVILGLVLAVPAGVVLGLALYYRSPAYRRYVAGELESALGLQVSLGGVERVGWSGLRLTDLSMGGSVSVPLLTASRASLTRDEQGLFDVTLEDVSLTIRSPGAFEELLFVPRAALFEPGEPPGRRGVGVGVRVGRQGQVGTLRFSGARFEWTIDDSLRADSASGLLTWPRPGKPGEARLTLARGGDRVCQARWVGGQAGGSVMVTFDGVPATLVKMAGLLSELPVGSAVMSGEALSPELGSDQPTAIELTFADLPLGPLAEHWGVPGLAASARGTFKLEAVEERDVRLRGIEVMGREGAPGWITVQALRRLAHLIEADPADVPDTAGRIRLTRLALSVAREDDRLILSGGLEPAGTVLEGELAGDTAPRVLLRLGRTAFTLDELDRRLAEVRAGEIERPARPTARPTTQPASRPAP